MEYWLDGFNLFYRWEATRAAFSSHHDIAATQEKAIRLLSRALAEQRRHTVVFLDGGLRREELVVAGLQVRYCGPGNKADDYMTNSLAGINPRERRAVIAVSNDRELRNQLQQLGATCLGADEFLAVLEKRKPETSKAKNRHAGKKNQRQANKHKPNTGNELIREKFQILSATEIQAWLDYFGGEPAGDILENK